MSYIIDDSRINGGQRISPSFNPKTQQQPKRRFILKAQQKMGLVSDIERLSLPLKGRFLGIQASNQSATSFMVLFANLFHGLQGLARLTVRHQAQHCVLNITLLQPGGQNFLKVSSKQRKQLLYKAIFSQCFQSSLREFKLSVNEQTRNIQLTRQLFLGKSPAQPSDYLKLFKGMCSLLIEDKDVLAELLFQILGLSCRSERIRDTELMHSHRRGKESTFLSKIHLLNFYVSLSDEETSQEKYLKSEMEKQLRSIQKIQSEWRADSCIRESCRLYFECSQQIHGKNIDVDVQDKRKITKKLRSIGSSQVKKTAEGILNYINLLKPIDERLLQPISRGGFTIIFLACIKFQLTGSHSDDGEQIDNPYKRSQPQQRWMVLKRQVTASPRNRNHHQIQILKRIKNGNSPLLPHYYVQHGKNDLFVDHIQSPTLHEFIRLTRNSLSLKTKLHIGFLLTQALRHLERYSIIHLDVKPSNLMVNSPYLKLIDFGQSYHPFLENNSQYRPGFTYPYSAPENYHYYGTKFLSTKCDVFSIGVILHQLLIGRMPFDIPEGLRQRVYREAAIDRYWWWCPEENQNFGQPLFWPVIQLLVGKCLHSQPYHRPQLLWVAYMLRCCLDNLY